MKKGMLWLCLLLALCLLPISSLAADSSRITSRAQLENYLRDRAEEKDTDFTFTYDTALNLHNKTEETAALMQQMGMNSFKWEYTPGRIRVYNINYSDEFAICRTKTEVRAYLAWCARYQVGEFALFLGKDLYRELKADNFSGLRALENEARIVSRDLSYSDQACAVYFSHADYQLNAQTCASLVQVMDVLKAGATELQDTIHIFCTQEIYRYLMADDTALLHQMLSAQGGETYSYSVNESSKITLSEIRYRAGHKIYQAYRKGNYSSLSQREYDTLLFAVNAINAGNMPGDILGAEKWIHDYLCDRVTYTIDDFSNEDDCAVGALLNGRANCDGYADAFYLMGSLVGMEIRCQSGDALRADGDAGHMWNLIRLNNDWYMVDVTWNDSDNGAPAHIWYNLGADFARYSHTWEELSGMAPMAERTENAYRPYPIFRCYSFDDLSRIMGECKLLRTDRADIFYGFGTDLYENTDRAYDVMRRAGVSGSIRSTWYDRPGFVHFYGLQY